MAKQRHLARLDHVWSEQPLFFVTTCTKDRRDLLASSQLHEICREVWQNAERLYGWSVGRYVLMPDHAHFFCAPRFYGQELQVFVGKWKEWTAKYASRRLLVSMPLWQDGFFDHVIRSSESYDEKWEYVRENPVRARLASASKDWPYQGEIHAIAYDS